MKAIRKKLLCPSRRSLYFMGVTLCGVGLLLFVSVLASVVRSAGDLSNFELQARSIGVRVLGGVALISVGFALMTLTDSVLSDESGIDEFFTDEVHNATSAREQPAEPLAQGAGTTAGVTVASAGDSRSVGICCLGCRAINDRHARYCDQCGRRLRHEPGQIGNPTPPSSTLTQSA